MSLEKNARSIQLTQDRRSIVDAELYDDLSKYKWYAMASGNKYYAARNTTIHNIGTLILMHRQIMNAASDQSVEHINGNSLDNRKENLRLIGGTNRRNFH